MGAGSDIATRRAQLRAFIAALGQSQHSLVRAFSFLEDRVDRLAKASEQRGSPQAAAADGWLEMHGGDLGRHVDELQKLAGRLVSLGNDALHSTILQLATLGAATEVPPASQTAGSAGDGERALADWKRDYSTLSKEYVDRVGTSLSALIESLGVAVHQQPASATWPGPETPAPEGLAPRPSPVANPTPVPAAVAEILNAVAARLSPDRATRRAQRMSQQIEELTALAAAFDRIAYLEAEAKRQTALRLEGQLDSLPRLDRDILWILNICLQYRSLEGWSVPDFERVPNTIEMMRARAGEIDGLRGSRGDLVNGLQHIWFSRSDWKLDAEVLKTLNIYWFLEFGDASRADDWDVAEGEAFTSYQGDVERVITGLRTRVFQRGEDILNRWGEDINLSRAVLAEALRSPAEVANSLPEPPVVGDQDDRPRPWEGWVADGQLVSATRASPDPITPAVGDPYGMDEEQQEEDQAEPEPDPEVVAALTEYLSRCGLDYSNPTLRFWPDRKRRDFPAAIAIWTEEDGQEKLLGIRLPGDPDVLILLWKRVASEDPRRPTRELQ